MKYESEDEIMRALHAPFPEECCKQKKDKYGNVLRNLDGTPFDFSPARVYMNRLDEVMGVANWRPRYEETPQGVRCVLLLRINGEWIEKEDLGGYAGMGQKDKQTGEFYIDEENNGKSGYSDAFKRACVVWGIGRFLYHEGVPDFVRDLYEASPHARQFLPENCRTGGNAAPSNLRPSNGNSQPPAANGQPNGPSNGNGNKEWGPPRTGRQFYAWMKKQETDSGMQLQKQVENFAKSKGQASYSGDWPDSFVPEAMAFVERVVSGATDQTVEAPARKAEPAPATAAPSFYGLLETLLNQWDKIDRIDSAGRIVRRVELIEEAHRALVAKGKLKAIEGASEDELFDAVEEVYPANRITIRAVLTTCMALQGVQA